MLFVGWLAALLAVPACSSGDDATDDVVVEVAGRAPDWIHPACTTEALGPPGAPGGAASCNGPWSYRYQERCHGAGAPVCTARTSCASWDRDVPGDQLGIVWEDRSETSGGYTWVCTKACRTCQTRCSGSGEPASKCNALAIARRPAIVAQLPASPPAGVSAAVRVTGSATQVVSDTSPIDNGGVETSTFYNCTLAIHTATQLVGPNPVCPCSTWSQPTCWDRDGAEASSPGLPIPSGSLPPLATNPLATRTVVAGTQLCQTCDELPLTDASAKLACYERERAVAGASAALRESLAARMKLLLKLAGERLTAAERARIETIYDSDPAAAPACSEPIVWAPTCQAEAASLRLPGQLQLCQDLATAPISGAATVGVEVAHCIDQLATTTQISDPVCRLPARDLADVLARKLVTSAQPSFAGTAASLTATIPPVMARLGAWRTAARTAARTDRAWLEGRTSAIARALWAAIYPARSPLPTSVGTTDDAVRLLEDVEDDGLELDFAALQGLFEPGQTPTELHLVLTGDTLAGLDGRLAHLELMHDVGCRFAQCAATNRRSAASQLVRVLAAIPSAAALTTALTEATALASQQPALHAALSRLRDQHAYLVAAWAALGRTDNFSALATITDPPVEAAQLAAIVRRATLAWTSYQATGQFVPWLAPRLTSSVLQRPALVAMLDRLVVDAAAERARYEVARLDTVNDLITQTRQAGAIQSSLDRRKVLALQQQELAMQQLGLEEREAAERARLADYQRAFETIITGGGFNGGAAYATLELPVLTASAADAKFPAVPATGVPPVLTRDRFANVRLQTGESLRVRVNGAWGPTCSIRTATLPGPDGPLALQVGDATTGPRGFWATLENNSFKSHSKSDDSGWKTSIGTSAESCLAGDLDFLPVRLPKAITGTWKACAHASFDKFWSSTTTDANGHGRRLSANFEVGVRLANTPYPSAPAGSLVAVITVADQPGEVLDVQVVHESDLIVAPNLPGGASGAVDVHFVVNDGADTVRCPLPELSPSLHIELFKTTPVGVVARAVGAATANTLTALESQAPAILAQGQLSGTELGGLRAAAWLELQLRLATAGLDVAGLPPDLRQLFDGFLEGRLASLARRAQIHGAEIERLRLDLERDALTNDLTAADEVSRLMYLVPRWRLRTLQGDELMRANRALAEALTAYVAPVYELRDPAGFSGFRAAVGGAIDPLIDVNLTARLEDSIAKFDTFAGAATTAVATAQFDLPEVNRKIVIAAIPKGTATYLGSYLTVSRTTAERFWATVPSGTASITLTPADLYRITGGASRLTCGDLGAVVRRYELFIDTTSQYRLQDFGHEVPAVAGLQAPVTFPVSGRDLQFALREPSGVAMSMRVASGSNGEVLASMSQLPNDLFAGAGISPFTSFEIDMGFRDSEEGEQVLDMANAALLVFEIESRTTTQSVRLPAICTAP